jgi:hypothetical protein
MSTSLGNLKIPDFFLEVLTLIVGFNFILLLNHLFRIDVRYFSNIDYINDLMKTVLLFSVSYFCGVVFTITSDIWLNLIDFIFLKNKKDKFKQDIKMFVEIVNREKGKFNNKSNSTSYEIEEYIEQNKFVKNKITRLFCLGHCRNLILGFLLIMLILLSLKSAEYYWFVLVIIGIIILTVKYIQSSISYNKIRMSIAEYLSKIKRKERNN